MLKLSGVKKKYGDFSMDCTMEVPAGMIVGLVGANGAGKSTTFKSILGLIHPDDGRIELFGEKKENISIQDKQRIGAMLGGSGINMYLTIQKAVPILRSFYPNFSKEKFLQKCAEYKLPLNKKIKDFSTGMKTRLHILVALCHDAELLILDEPTVGLDVVARKSVQDMLREFMEEEGRSILISSHISSDLENFCDVIYVIHEGRIILKEEGDILLDSYGLLKVSEKQYEALDKRYISYQMKEDFGYSCFTPNKAYYLENYPDLVVEKGSVDALVLMIEKGEKCSEMEA